MSSSDAATTPFGSAVAFAGRAAGGNTGVSGNGSGTNNGPENDVNEKSLTSSGNGNKGTALPMPVPRLGEADPNKDIPTLRLGETITFEEMGPVIVNVDGTTRRINNWNDLSDKEREVTWRRISKRNEERRKKLLKAMHQQQQDAAEGSKDTETH